MKRILLLVFLVSCMGVTAQNISVKSFQQLPMDMTASSIEGKRIDQNGEVAALIKVVTNETDFVFEGGTLGIVGAKRETGEWWVWVPRGLRKITIKHPQLGILRDYRFPVEIEAERTYEMVLLTGKVETVVTPSFTSQFLMFNITPKDVMLTVDGETWPVTDGTARKMVAFGNHEYRVEAQDYHNDAGMVMVNDPENTVIVNVSLKPAFGYLKITGDQTILSGATIYIDNGKSPNILRSSEKLKSGQHKVSVIHPKYKPYERMITISDDETTTLNVNLDANFSNVTLKVDADAEIYVNNELKGTRSWTGDLDSGTYLFETRKKGHRSITEQKVITESMSGQTIQLEPPIPINGTLVVSSTPDMAKLFIDGKEVGVTPKRINSILIGQHTLRLEKSGCAPVTKTVVIEEGKTLEVDERLDTGRNLTIKTDREGDKIFVDGDYVGETPCVTPLGFGQHTIRVTRDKGKAEKVIEVTTSSTDQELMFEFGRLVRINTDQTGDLIFVDGKQVGTSPVSVDIPFGKHVVHAQRGKKYADKDIEVLRSGGLTEHRLVLHGETATHFVERGVNFVTLNAAYDTKVPSFGVTYGSVKQLGWFVTVMSNFSFEALNSLYSTDNQGLVNGEYPYFQQGASYSRLSVMSGLVARVAGPLCFKVGAGYGSMVMGQKLVSGEMVKITNSSYQGVDATAGLQLNLKGFSVNLDAVTTNFTTLEVKLGVGCCWKRK